MTCDEFRRWWTDREPETADDPSGPTSHRSDCPACLAWLARQRALDGALTTALLIAPPAELSGRLARIPAPAPGPAAESLRQRVLAFAFLVVVALSAIGISGITLGFLLDLALPTALNTWQAVTLILGSPLVGYYQNAASTLLEALATLVLAALVFLQLQPAASPPRGS